MGIKDIGEIRPPTWSKASQTIERQSTELSIQEKGREKLLELCGGRKPDVVVILGGGRTKRTSVVHSSSEGDTTIGSTRERTSPYTGKLTIEPNPKTGPLASGVSPRVWAAATLARHFSPDEYITLGGGEISSQIKDPSDPYSGNGPSADVMADELHRWGHVEVGRIKKDYAPTTTATELMEIIIETAGKVKENPESHRDYNCVIIASGYQTPRLEAFLEKIYTGENWRKGLEWFLQGHEKGIEMDESISDKHAVLAAFSQQKDLLESSIQTLKDQHVNLTPVSAENILRYRSWRWRRIVDKILPKWAPWINRMRTDALSGVSDIKNQQYSFKGAQTKKYLKNLGLLV